MIKKEEALARCDAFLEKMSLDSYPDILREAVYLLHDLSQCSVATKSESYVKIAHSKEFVYSQRGLRSLKESLGDLIDDMFNYCQTKGFNERIAYDYEYDLKRLKTRVEVYRQSKTPVGKRSNRGLVENWLRNMVANMQIMLPVITPPESPSERHRTKPFVRVQVSPEGFKKLHYLKCYFGFASNQITLSYLITCASPIVEHFDNLTLGFKNEIKDILEYVDHVSDEVLCENLSEVLSRLRGGVKTKKKEGLVQISFSAYNLTTKDHFYFRNMGNLINQRLDILASGGKISNLQKDKKPIDRVAFKKNLETLLFKLSRVRSALGVKKLTDTYIRFFQHVLWEHHGLEALKETTKPKDKKLPSRLYVQRKTHVRLFNVTNQLGFKTLSHASAFVLDPNRQTW